MEVVYSHDVALSPFPLEATHEALLANRHRNWRSLGECRVIVHDEKLAGVKEVVEVDVPCLAVLAVW